MANQYSNLGNLYATRGDLDAAEAMWKKSLAVFQELGIISKVQMIQGFLLDLEKERG